jgi:F420H(2)-dependent quinone reductase
MSDQSVRGKMSDPTAIPEPRAQKLAMQDLVNRLMRGMLATPLLSRALGSRLVTLYIVGRKSGRRYTIPVAYTRDKGDLLIGTPFGWGRNLRTGEPVEIRLKGRRRQADVLAYKDEADVAAAYVIMARDNKAFANFNKIGFDADGNPDPEDLHLAWMAGARAFRLTPRLSGSACCPVTSGRTSRCRAPQDPPPR